MTDNPVDFEIAKTDSDAKVNTAVDLLETAYDKFKETLNDYITEEKPRDKKWYDGFFKLFTGACPVNMTLKDSQGNVLAYINEDGEYFAEGIYGERIGDIKRFYVPADLEVGT